MVTIDHPGPQLDEVTLTVRGRTVVLSQYSDKSLLERALKELERSFVVLKDQYSSEDESLMGQAIIRLSQYRMGYG